MERTFIHPLQPSLAKFKSHLRITSDDLDDELSDKLQAAIRSAEAVIGRVIASSFFEREFRFAESINLKGPVIEVLEVTVDNEPASGWRLMGNHLVMPLGMSGRYVEVRWKAGMEQVPADITAAILMKGARLFNNPGDSVDTLTTASDNLLRPYRTWGLYDEDGEQD